ncbi:hypothetical protein D9M73_51400 [compost metagenome]|jgi:hypothetical protein
MFKNLPAVWLVPIFSLSGIAAAQTPALASPAPEATQASTLTYRSAFEGYKPYTDDKLLNWKEANDTTGRIGGWRAYAKEARQPDDKAPAHDMATMPDPKTGGSKP